MNNPAEFQLETHRAMVNIFKDKVEGIISTMKPLTNNTDIVHQKRKDKEFDKPPSQRKRPKWVAVPPPLTDIWRVFYNDQGKYKLICFCRDVDRAYEEADKVWHKTWVGERNSIRVDHKGGMVIQGNVYLVNVLPIKLVDRQEYTYTAPPSETVVDEEKISKDERSSYTKNHGYEHPENPW